MSHIIAKGGQRIGTGDRIRVQGVIADQIGTFSIAGSFMKVTAKSFDVTGEVRHVRGDHPTAPITIGFFIAPEGEIDRAQHTVFCDKCQKYETVIEFHDKVKFTVLDKP